MQIQDLRSAWGTRKRRKRLGRGQGSGHGKTCCRGQKGQTSRSGRGILRGSEGGQVALIRRLPKIGFRSHRPIFYQIVKISQLGSFNDGSMVDALFLKKQGLIQSLLKPYKILAAGEIKKNLTVRAYSFSKNAKEKILQAGGQVEIIGRSDVLKFLEKESHLQ